LVVSPQCRHDGRYWLSKALWIAWVDKRWMRILSESAGIDCCASFASYNLQIQPPNRLFRLNSPTVSAAEPSNSAKSGTFGTAVGLLPSPMPQRSDQFSVQLSDEGQRHNGSFHSLRLFA